MMLRYRPILYKNKKKGLICQKVIQKQSCKDIHFKHGKDQMKEIHTTRTEARNTKNKKNRQTYSR